MDEQDNLNVANDSIVGGLIDEADVPEDAYIQDDIDESSIEDQDDIDESTIDEIDGIYEPGQKKKKINAKTRRENPYNLTEDELEYIFEKRRTLEMESREKTKYYHEKQSVGYFGDNDAESLKSRERKEAQTLIAAARAPKPQILSGTVIGFTKTENMKMPIVNVELEGGTGINQIKIPAPHFCYYDRAEYENGTETAARHLTSLIEAHIGARVNFIVYEFNEKEHIAYASRLAALNIISSIYYIRKDRKVNTNKVIETGRPRIYPGVVANAKVIALFRDRIIVDVCGVDVEMKKAHLSWSSISRLDSEFELGDQFRVKVMEIGKPVPVKIGNQTYRKIPVVVSKRELEPKPEDLYYDQFNVGDSVQGVIKSETASRGLFVKIAGKMDCLCPPLPVPVQYNSTCIVRITNKYPEGKRITGTILANTVRPPKSEY